MVVLVNDSHLLDLGVERELSSEMDVESGEKSLLAHVETGSENMQCDFGWLTVRYPRSIRYVLHDGSGRS